jgi:hypothetical protein
MLAADHKTPTLAPGPCTPPYLQKLTILLHIMGLSSFLLGIALVVANLQLGLSGATQPPPGAHVLPAEPLALTGQPPNPRANTGQPPNRVLANTGQPPVLANTGQPPDRVLLANTGQPPNLAAYPLDRLQAPDPHHTLPVATQPVCSLEPLLKRSRSDGQPPSSLELDKNEWDLSWDGFNGEWLLGRWFVLIDQNCTL